jgi:hypothetical protein
MNHTLFVKTYDQHGFDLGLFQTKLVGPRWLLWGPCILWCFVSGAYPNIYDSSPVTMQSRKLGLSWQVWVKSWHDMGLRCFCSSVRLCGTNSAQIFLFRKSSWRIWRIVSLLMFNSSDIILRDNRRSHVTISRIFTIVSAFRKVEGRPLLGSSWRSWHASLNRWNHSNTLLRLRLHHHRQYATTHKFLLKFYQV